MLRISKLVTVIILWMLMTVPAGSAASSKTVFVSILPQKYFVEQIGGKRVAVDVMVQPGASPATYEPRPRQMARLSKAGLYFSIGVPFEKAWLKKIAAANPDMEIIHTDHNIPKIPMATYHAHGAGTHLQTVKPPMHDGHLRDTGHNASGIPDPHIWLSPPLVKQQAETILTALIKIDPSHQAFYHANYKQFMTDIDDLHNDLKAVFANKQDLQFMVFHPSWGYFAQAYGLKQIPIEIEGKTPKPAQLKTLIQHARENKINVIFVQPQFSTQSAEVVAGAIGGRVVFADPLAENWSGNLRKVAAGFRAALK